VLALLSALLPLGAEWVSPLAVLSASGPAFPLGRVGGNPPDPEYAAERTIDGDPASFCCLLDDTPTGADAGTIPPHGSSPVTGTIVFDLGQPLPIAGIRLTARLDAGPLNPRQVTFVTFAGDLPPQQPRAGGALPVDATLLAARQEVPPLREGAAWTATWPAVSRRYLGLLVHDSYEAGGMHWNFQVAEVEVAVELAASALPPALRTATSRARERLNQLVDLAALRQAIVFLGRAYPDRYPARELLARLEEWQGRLGQSPESAASADAFEAMSSALQAFAREALVLTNPLLSPGRLLFVKRYTYQTGWYYAEFMQASRCGGGLFILSLPEGQVAEVAPELRMGIVDRYDLSFAGTRIAFGYKPAPDRAFRLCEIGVDGTGFRQLTSDPPEEAAELAAYSPSGRNELGPFRRHTDDFHPCYLPDGGICFASSRCRQGVLCDQPDQLSVNTLYRLNADGSGSEPLSLGALSESTPALMNDGRILYTRWEYVDKGVIAVQDLWAMRPDGSGSAEVYGSAVESPPVLIHARPLPGDAQALVCTATMHHPFAVGPILLLDLGRDIRTAEPMRSLTPDTDVDIAPPGTFPGGERFVHRRGNTWVADNRGPLFCEPFPLHDPAQPSIPCRFFLVTCNPDQAWNHPAAYGLWLIDSFGNRVPIYHDPDISCWQPMPLRARVVPPVVAATAHLPADETAPAPAARPAEQATVVMQDVRRGLGLPGVPPGVVRHLRIWEQVPRPWSAHRFWPHDEALGQHAPISLNAHIYVKVLHGIVPVEADGSAHFTVPAERNLFFQALDADLMEVQRMRTFVRFRPGEVRACLGCHSRNVEAPVQRPALALLRPPATPAAQPGDRTVPRPVDYSTDVQPILDRHCLRCHSPGNKAAKLDFGGALTPYFSRSYETILSHGLIACVQEFQGPQPEAQKTNALPLPPRALGTHASPLIAVLRQGHHHVTLTRAEMNRLVTWVDANGPYYGTYFGRRHLSYQGLPDFRPVATLESAWGIPAAQPLRAPGETPPTE
jgi:hypothetical protein